MGERTHSLDALRGVAALSTLFAALIAFKGLPDWMYPAQVDPKSLAIYPGLSGLNWPDLVFPTFLFGLGVSIPFALERDPGKSSFLKAASYIISRTFGLAVLALAVGQATDGSALERQTDFPPIAWLLVCVLMVARFPTTIEVPVQVALRFIGFLLVLLGLVQYPLNLSLADPYLATVACLFLASSCLYVLIRKFTFGWWAIWLFVLGTILAAQGSESLQQIWNLRPVPHWIEVGYLQWLLVTIPAILIGQCKAREESGIYSPYRIAGTALAFLGIVGTLASLTTQRADWLVVGSSLACVTSLILLRKEPLDRNISLLGWSMITFGVLMTSVTGDTKATNGNLSYVLLSGGMCALGFLVLKNLDRVGGRPEIVRVSPEGFSRFHQDLESIGLEETLRPGFLANLGRNSFLAYLVTALIALPLLRPHYQEGIEGLRDGWQIVGAATAVALAVGFLVGQLSRARIFVRP